MQFVSSQPVVAVTHGHYPDRTNPQMPMKRRDGTIVEWIEVIGTDAPLGTPLTQLTTEPGVIPMDGVPEGSHVKLTISLTTQQQARMGKNGVPYTATVLKQRVTALEVVRVKAAA